MNKLFSLVIIVLHSLSAIAVTNAQSQPTKPITLEGPSQSPQALYVQAVLESAYANLGYQVVYQNVPLARSFIEANAGRLDGLRARVGNVESDFPNLVKAPFPILTFNMVMIANRKKCGACLFESVSNIAVTRGFRAFEQFREKSSNSANIIYVTRPQQAFELLIDGKVDAAVMSDTNVPAHYYKMDHSWIKTTLQVLPDYHYLHKKHQGLVPQLTKIFTAMARSGELASLKQQFGISPDAISETSSGFGEITTSTASWTNYTDTPQGTYFTILNEIFSSTATKVTNRVTNWKRAKQLFYDGSVDILIGAYSFEGGANASRSEIHIDYELPVIAFAKGEDTLDRVLSENGQGSVCYVLGYGLDGVLSEKVAVYEAPTTADCVRMLENDRLDVMLDYEKDIPAWLINKYAQKQMLEGLPLFLIFQNTPRGEQLKWQFEKGMRTLIREQRMAAFFPSPTDYKRAKFVVNTD